MKVLFTGSLGLVGSHVVPLLANRWEMIATDLREGSLGNQKIVPADLCNFDQVIKIVEGVDAVVHCAIYPHKGISPRDHEKWHQYLQGAIQVNCAGTYNLFEAAARCKVKKIVQISSLSTMLRSPLYHQLCEELPDRVQNVYSCTKLFSEKLSEVFAADHEMNVFNLRLGDPTPIEKINDLVQILKSEGGRSCGSITLMEDIALAIDGSLRSTLTGSRLYHIVTPSNDPWVSYQKAKNEIGYDSPYFITESGVQKR